MKRGSVLGAVLYSKKKYIEEEKINHGADLTGRLIEIKRENLSNQEKYGDVISYLK